MRDKAPSLVADYANGHRVTLLPGYKLEEMASFFEKREIVFVIGSRARVPCFFFGRRRLILLNFASTGNVNR